MYMKYKIKNIYFLFFCVLIVLYVLYYWIEFDEDAMMVLHDRTIENDGYCILYNEKYNDILDNTYNKTDSLNFLKKKVLQELIDGYVFIDYSYEIKNNSLYTFHRDVTSSQYIYNTDFPVYTCIVYKYDGELLSLCPNSHRTYPFVCSRIINYSGKSGTCFLFNCDVLHAGMPNIYCKDKSIIQYKICHKDDLSKLKHLTGIKQKYNKECIPFTGYNYFQRKFSYFFEMPINTFFSPVLEKKYEEGSFMGTLQSYFNTLSFYNNN